MKLGLQNEPEIEALSGGLAQTLRDNVSATSAAFNREHDTDTDRHGTITALGTIAERGRTVPMGEWIDVPYGSVAFTASGTMVWGVAAADQLTYRYMLVGKTLWLSFAFTTTSVTAPLNTVLQLALPPGFTAANTLVGTPYWYSDNGTEGIGLAQVLANTSIVRLFILGSGNWTASVNNTAMEGQIMVAIQ